MEIGSDRSQSYKGRVVEALKFYFPNGVSPEEFAVMLETLIDIGECMGGSSNPEGLLTVH